MINTVLDEDFFNRDGLCVKLIRKYAVLLSIFLLLEVVFNLLMPYAVLNFFGPDESGKMRLLLYIPSYLISIITAIVVHHDMKKTSSVSWAIVVAACLYNELGVCLFLVNVMYVELQSMMVRR